MPLPLLSHDQLLTANFFDFRQIVLCKLPKHIWRDVIVSMAKNIADPCYFWPRNFGSSLLYVVREMTARFGNDFNSALNQPALFPILFECFKSHAIQYATNAFDRFMISARVARRFVRSSKNQHGGFFDPLIDQDEGRIHHTLSASILSYSAWVPKNRIANTQPHL